MAEAQKRESVEVRRPTLIGGGWVEEGDSVEVYPFQRRHMVDAGLAEGKFPDDVASDGEKDAGALDVLKRADKRDDIDVWSVERAHKEGYGYGEASDESSGQSEASDKSSSDSEGQKKSSGSNSASNSNL